VEDKTYNLVVMNIYIEMKPAKIDVAIRFLHSYLLVFSLYHHSYRSCLSKIMGFCGLCEVF
jgi:hypothetical protein